MKTNETTHQKCLLVYPEFTTASFWNYRATCEIVGAKYPAAPLGLATVGALLPQNWDIRLVDCNVEKLDDKDIEWADIVLSGGMIAQQQEHLKLIDRVKKYEKIHIIGGPDPTSSPQLYESADHLILGEAEITMPRFLEDFAQGKAQRKYCPGEEKADMTTSPVPRFDLMTFRNYLHVGIQFARGCPFKCEFCDIIELFGRKPRVKTADQILAELDRLYELGYRGHVDLVDDNFIGNRRAVNELLPAMKKWLEEHNWPYEFSIEASMNLADDEKLMDLMQDVGFVSVFMGIETPDEETLLQTQKKQNTARSIPESVHKLFRRGMLVNAGYIVGFDNEKDNVAKNMIRVIDETAIPLNMVGLLFALPNTQLTRRLTKEGRLEAGSEVVSEDAGDQCLTGLNFETKRPKLDILKDYKKIVDSIYTPDAYFDRAWRFIEMMDCSKKKLKIPLMQQIRDIGVFIRLVRKVGRGKDFSRHFWSMLYKTLRYNPKAMRYSMALVGLYVHFGEFAKMVSERIVGEMEKLRNAKPVSTGMKVGAPLDAPRPQPMTETAI